MILGKYKFLPLAGVLLSYSTSAQSFKSKAFLGPVVKDGFYSILLTPELSSHVKPDFCDLRISDNNGEYVPYIVRTGIISIQGVSFSHLSVVSNAITDSGKSIIVLENNSRLGITEFYLKLKNTSVSRAADLEGGDDGVRWYSIAENINLFGTTITDSENCVVKVGFPLSSYRYFRLIIYNGRNAPLNVLSADSYLPEKIDSIMPLVENGVSRFERKDSSNHFTYLRVGNPRLFHISKIRVRARVPMFFKRNFEILIPRRQTNHFQVTQASQMRSVHPDSTLEFGFKVPTFDDSVFYIVIENGEDPPFSFSSISTEQDYTNIVAYFFAGRKYALEMGNDSIGIPHYELQEFLDSIPKSIPEIQVSMIQNIELKPPAVRSSAGLKWIWITIGIAMVILVIFTVRLSRDVANAKKN